MPTAQNAAPIKAVPVPTQRPYTRRNSSGTLRLPFGEAVMYPKKFITPPPMPKTPISKSKMESIFLTPLFCPILAHPFEERKAFP